MWPIVSEPASPQSAASGISPMPALSRTIRIIRSKALSFIQAISLPQSRPLPVISRSINIEPFFCQLPTAFCLLALWRVVTFARSDLRAAAIDAFDFNMDCAKASIVRFIGRVVAQTVLRAYLVCDLCEGCTCVTQVCGWKSLAAGDQRKIIHLVARKCVEAAANLHTLERPHAAEVVEASGVCARDEDSAVKLKLRL